MKALLYSYNGQSKTAKEWKKILNSNIPLSTLTKRLKKSKPEDFLKCFHYDRFNKAEAIEYIGKTLFNIKILEYIPNKHSKVKCQCHCGNIFTPSFFALKVGRVKSCGCAKKRIGSNHSKYKGFEQISQTRFHAIKRGAESRNINFDVSIEYLWNLYLIQHKLCAISGLEIYFNSSRSHGTRGTASLDRIDSTKGYVEGNVQWVHKDINFMKQDFSEKEFYTYIKTIYEFKNL